MAYGFSSLAVCFKYTHAVPKDKIKSSLSYSLIKDNNPPMHKLYLNDNGYLNL